MSGWHLICWLISCSSRLLKDWWKICVNGTAPMSTSPHVPPIEHHLNPSHPIPSHLIFISCHRCQINCLAELCHLFLVTNLCLPSSLSFSQFSMECVLEFWAIVLVSCQQVRFEDLSYSLMVNEKKSLPYRFDSEFEPVVYGSLINQTGELEIHQNAVFC